MEFELYPNKALVFFKGKKNLLPYQALKILNWKCQLSTSVPQTRKNTFPNASKQMESRQNTQILSGKVMTPPSKVPLPSQSFLSPTLSATALLVKTSIASGKPQLEHTFPQKTNSRGFESAFFSSFE